MKKVTNLHLTSTRLDNTYMLVILGCVFGATSGCHIAWYFCYYYKLIWAFGRSLRVGSLPVVIEVPSICHQFACVLRLTPKLRIDFPRLGPY